MMVDGKKQELPMH